MYMYNIFTCTFEDGCCPEHVGGLFSKSDIVEAFSKVVPTAGK
jgi:hypothetical protein